MGISLALKREANALHLPLQGGGRARAASREGVCASAFLIGPPPYPSPLQGEGRQCCPAARVGLRSLTVQASVPRTPRARSGTPRPRPERRRRSRAG